jgi:hypothetical protein
MTLSQIATYIWVNELDGNPSAAGDITKIADYLEVNIGQLNILLNTDFESGPLLDEEAAVLIQLYLRDYYKKKSRTVLHSALTSGGSSGGTSEWTELREGDSVIKRVATLASPAQKTAMSKSYQSLSSQANEELKGLVQKYNLYMGKPRQVIGDFPADELD